MTARTIIVLAYFFCLTALQAAHPIILISIDGLRPDAISATTAPTLSDLIAQGTSFNDALTVRPSITLPSHTSMLTGLDPTQHGITWNSYRPSYGPVRHPTALEIANNAGLDTAIFVAKDKLLHLNRPGGVDYFVLTDTDGQSIASAFSRYVRQHGLPDVTFLHLPDPDKMGHRYGWMSRQYLNGVSQADRAVAAIIQTAKQARRTINPTVIVTADHGGSGRDHDGDARVNNLIPFIVLGDGIPLGVVRTERVRVYDAAATILSLLNLPVPELWSGRPVPLNLPNVAPTPGQDPSQGAERLRPVHERPILSF